MTASQSTVKSPAALAREMASAGATAEAVALALEAIEQASSPKPKTPGAIRQGRYRAKLSGVTSDVTSDITSDNTLRNDSSLSVKSPPPKEIKTPTQNLTTFGGRTRGEWFDEAWKVYPRRKGTNPKQLARERFFRLMASGTDPTDIIAGIKAYAQTRAGEPPQFTMQFARFLSQGVWMDDHSPPPGTRMRSDPEPQPFRNPFLALAVNDRQNPDDEPSNSFDGSSARSSAPRHREAPPILELCAEDPNGRRAVSPFRRYANA